MTLEKTMRDNPDINLICKVVSDILTDRNTGVGVKITLKGNKSARINKNQK